MTRVEERQQQRNNNNNIGRVQHLNLFMFLVCTSIPTVAHQIYNLLSVAIVASREGVSNPKEERGRPRHDEDIGTSHDKVHSRIITIIHVGIVHKIVPGQVEHKDENVNGHILVFL